MLVKVTVLADGHGPSEKLVGVKTSDGEMEQVVVSKRILKDNHIEVGLALSQQGNSILIELPRESTKGRWRVWVPESEIVTHLEAAE